MENAIISQLKEIRARYQYHVDSQILVGANLIVEVGALTVGLTADRHIETINAIEPWQFGRDGVNEILAVKFWDGSGNAITPKVWNWKDWYRAQVAMVDETLAAIAEMEIA